MMTTIWIIHHSLICHDMISGFPLDYMHLMCLGVERKSLCLWLKMPLEIRLGIHAIGSMSEKLAVFSGQVPLNFRWKPRPLTYLDQKATELQQFLLYTGMFRLHSLVDESLYNNFIYNFTLGFSSPIYPTQSTLVSKVLQLCWRIAETIWHFGANMSP